MLTKKFFLKGEKKEALVFVLVSFIAWRVWLQFFLWLGWFVMPLGDKFLGGGMKDFLEHPGLWAWANFDGEHYLAIAHHGYGNFEQAFFPFYSFLIKTFVFPLKESLFALLLSGLTISHLAFFLSLVVFYFLVCLDFEKKVAEKAILFLLVFPTSFFFAGVYTESVFLLFVVGSFYAARKGQWWLAGILGAIASATRLVGIFLLPALLWEWWEQNKNIKYLPQSGIPLRGKISNIKYLKSLIPIFLVPTGLLFYMRHLALNYKDPLMFLHVQPVFGAQRVADKIILLHQVFWRYLKMIATTRADPLYFTVWLEFLTGAGFLGLLIFSYLKKIRFSYLIFTLLAYITPTLTGTFSSMPRYVLVLFPCFVALALVENRILKALLLVVSCLLLAAATIFFTRGYFVG